MLLPGRPGCNQDILRTDTRSSFIGADRRGRGLGSPREIPGDRSLGPHRPAQLPSPEGQVYRRKGVRWPGKGPPYPHLGLEAEDGDRNGHHGSDDHCNDDGFGFIHTEGKKEFGEAKGIDKSGMNDFKIITSRRILPGIHPVTASPGMPHSPKHSLPKSAVVCP